MTSPQAIRSEAFYHIYNRGNNRENIFIEPRNYAHFLKLYILYIEPIAETYAYCLLRNHFHFLVFIKDEENLLVSSKAGSTLKLNPSQQFSKLFNAYAKSINQAYDRSGSLFQHPFGRVEIASDAHFTRLVTYIHQNPQKHHFEQDFRHWEYSSYNSILSGQPTRLRRDLVLEWFGGKERYKEAHSIFIPVGDVTTFVPEDFD